MSFYTRFLFYLAIIQSATGNTFTMTTSGSDRCGKPAFCLDSGSARSLSARILMPSDPEYRASENSYWSNTAKIGPACIIRASSVEQVSESITALVNAKQKFAVRSGGHAPLRGTNNIHNGVTIDLTLLNNIVYDPTTENISFGPGVRWKDVLGELQPYNRVVAGGREGQTGVGGFLLGGGNAWITAREGFACDNVVGFEIVLANGNIINATKETHNDLFRALKGGWNNFGVVTRFTIRTFVNHFIFGGVTVSPKEAIPRAITITENFTKNVVKYPDSSLIVVIGYLESLKDIVISGAVVEVKGVEDSPAWTEWSTLPTIMDTRGRKTMLDMGLETALAANQYTTWSTITVKNDKRILDKANELHEVLVQELLAFIPDGEFTTQLIFQPIPTLFGQHSLAKGGNVLGLERNTKDGILIQINSMLKTKAQESFATPKVLMALEELKSFAKTIENGLFDWVYINYADVSQNVLEGYGHDNIRFMKEVAAVYDPLEVFQTLCVGGFKLSDV